MKKPTFFLAFCLFAPLFLLAQNEAPAARRPQIGLVFGMDDNYRFLLETKSLIGGGSAKDVRNEIEKPSLCGRLGVDFWMPFRQKMTLHFGLRAAEQGYLLIENNNLTYGSEFQTGTYVFDPSLPHYFKMVEKNYFVEVPAALQVLILKKRKWRGYVEPGISPLIYLKTRQIITLGNSTKTNWTDRGHYRFHLMATASAGFERLLLGGRSALFAQPIFRMQVTPLHSGSIKEFPYNFGLLVGFKHRV